MTHPKTRFIAFTGSKEAGLRIAEQASKAQPGQVWIKRTVLEMGGKDAIIVDDEADLDAAVEGVALSAFGYQGQNARRARGRLWRRKSMTSFSRSSCAREAHEGRFRPRIRRIIWAR